MPISLGSEVLDLARTLKETRLRYGKSAEAVARAIGISNAYLIKVERGERNPLPLFYLRRYCNEVGATDRYAELARQTTEILGDEIRLKFEDDAQRDLFLALDAKLARKRLSEAEYDELTRLIARVAGPRGVLDIEVRVRFRRDIEDITSEFADAAQCCTNLAAVRDLLGDMGITLVRVSSPTAAWAHINADYQTFSFSREMIVNEETFRGLANGEGRARFTLFHEIGHFELCHLHQALLNLGIGKMNVRRGTLPPEISAEAQSDYWAAAALMPASEVRAMARSRSDIPALKDGVAKTFSVSITAASRRVNELLESGYLSI